MAHDMIRTLPVSMALAIALLGNPAPAADTIVFHGICDGSAAVNLGQDAILVAYDEENALYSFPVSGGDALARADLSGLLDLSRAEEIDIEAAALATDRIWWVGSHGRDGSGAPAPNRRRLFATNVPSPGLDDLVLLSGPLDLTDTFMESPPIAEILDDGVRRRHPKQGGVNIEGLAIDADGGLLVGFRSPLERDTGRALVVRLSPAGQSFTVRHSYLLDLGHRGIRDMTGDGNGYAIVAGPSGDEGDFALFAWTPPGSPVPVTSLSSLNAEAILDRDTHWLILSDDGKVRRQDPEAKKDQRQCDKIRAKSRLGHRHPSVYFRAERLEKKP